jgi:3-phenylpropionate/trans-cinnamate dioxygenase ferredoxin reductase subunit
MLGQQVTFDRLPYFFSDQYDLGMEFTGLAEPASYDRVVFRGRPYEDGGGTGAFIAFWVSQAGRVVAALNANIWDVVADLQALIRSAAAVSDERLADPEVPLSELAAT